MKYTIGQFNVKSKDLKANYEEIKRLAIQARQANYEMIVFGEYALTGYACGQLFLQADFYAEVDYYTNLLKDLSKDIIIVFGSVRMLDDKFYVTTTIAYNQTILYSDKENLSKLEFVEDQIFTAGKNQMHTINQQVINFTFKDDYQASDFYTVILDSSPINQSLPIIEPAGLYANTLGISHVAKVVYINGGSSFIQADQVYAFEHPLTAGIIESANELINVSKLDALVYGLRNFSLENFGPNKKWILGNSGGLDSAVTLSLMTIAFGQENVISYNLRSQYNSDKTVNNAANLAKALGVEHKAHSIDKTVSTYIDTLADFDYHEIPTLALENIQARTRGHLLGGFSSLEDAIISNNGNKLEIMLGYATLYGDTIGALSIIGDLLKIEVFELAKEINAYFKKEVVPNNLLPKVANYQVSFDMAPSAELKSDQKDPMKWYYHDYLVDLILNESVEAILELYLRDQFANIEIGKWLDFYDLKVGQNFIDDFNWFLRTFEINNFKRMQMPPVLAFSNNVINRDYIDSALVNPKSNARLALEKAIIEKYQ